jgi:hypothetical protein
MRASAPGRQIYYISSKQELLKSLHLDSLSRRVARFSTSHSLYLLRSGNQSGDYDS